MTRWLKELGYHQPCYSTIFLHREVEPTEYELMHILTIIAFWDSWVDVSLQLSNPIIRQLIWQMPMLADKYSYLMQCTQPHPVDIFVSASCTAPKYTFLEYNFSVEFIGQYFPWKQHNSVILLLTLDHDNLTYQSSINFNSILFWNIDLHSINMICNCGLFF